MAPAPAPPPDPSPATPRPPTARTAAGHAPPAPPPPRRPPGQPTRGDPRPQQHRLAAARRRRRHRHPRQSPEPPEQPRAGHHPARVTVTAGHRARPRRRSHTAPPPPPAVRRRHEPHLILTMCPYPAVATLSVTKRKGQASRDPRPTATGRDCSRDQSMQRTRWPSARWPSTLRTGSSTSRGDSPHRWASRPMAGRRTTWLASDRQASVAGTGRGDRRWFRCLIARVGAPGSAGQATSALVTSRDAAVTLP